MDGLFPAHHVHSGDREYLRASEKVVGVELITLRLDSVCDIDGVTPFVLLAICA